MSEVFWIFNLFDHAGLTKESLTEIFGILSTSSLYMYMYERCVVRGGGHIANRDLLGFLCKTPHDLIFSRYETLAHGDQDHLLNSKI